MKYLIFITLIAVPFTGYTQPASHVDLSKHHKVMVVEVIQTSGYTYLLVKENSKEQWMAVPKMEASAGETYYYKGEMEMKDFKSTELDRTFASVYFLGGLIPDISSSTTTKATPSEPAPEIKVGSNEIVEGIITISELLANKSQYENKTVRVRGKVTKYNANIMGFNWLHIDDGSGGDKAVDLTVTTSREAKVGDVLTLEGKIVLDKDFGYGYVYKVMMEEALISR